ncbi:MAG: hypothetical protein L6R40_007789, partial [Gallowayella cf. fulva]
TQAPTQRRPAQLVVVGVVVAVGVRERDDVVGVVLVTGDDEVDGLEVVVEILEKEEAITLLPGCEDETDELLILLLIVDDDDDNEDEDIGVDVRLPEPVLPPDPRLRHRRPLQPATVDGARDDELVMELGLVFPPTLLVDNVVGAVDAELLGDVVTGLLPLEVEDGAPLPPRPDRPTLRHNASVQPELEDVRGLLLLGRTLEVEDGAPLPPRPGRPTLRHNASVQPELEGCAADEVLLAAAVMDGMVRAVLVRVKVEVMVLKTPS